MYKRYRLYRRVVFAVKTEGNIDGRFLDKAWRATDIIFKARTETEAMQKANKFWQKGEFGAGSIRVILEEEDYGK